MTTKSFESLSVIANSLPCVAADRIARIIEKALAPAVLAGRQPHVEFHAIAAAQKYHVPVDEVRRHPIVAGLAALERMG